MRWLTRLVFWIALDAGVLAGWSATAQISDQAFDPAKALVAAGKLDDARTLLAARLAAGHADSETLFLLGLVATAQQDYDSAISFFRRILVNEPDAMRVRLELARAFFLKGDYDNATTQFRRARAAEVPDAVKINIDQYLAAMNRGNEWSYGFALALAPDTNVNLATSVEQVSLYGLPFTLAPSARARSGVGLTGDAHGEYAPLLNDWAKLRFGADLSSTDYAAAAFDDTTLSLYAGAQFAGDNWNVSPVLTGFDRFYGNVPFETGWGGRVSAGWGITAAWQSGIQIGVQQLDDRLNPAESGPLYSVQFSGGYAFSPSAAMQAMIGFNRDQADAPAFAYNGIWASLAYQRDLPLGFSVNLRPSYFRNQYDGPYAAFGVTRADHVAVLQLDLLNRRLDYHGFTPRFSYVFTGEASNIALYRYTRSQFQLGITSQF